MAIRKESEMLHPHEGVDCADCSYHSNNQEEPKYALEQIRKAEELSIKPHCYAYNCGCDHCQQPEEGSDNGDPCVYRVSTHLQHSERDEKLKYTPELGQYAFGNPTGEYAMPTFACALFDYLRELIRSCFWNNQQGEWDELDNPKIPGIEWRPYYWGDDEVIAAQPNFKFEDVEIRWYKHPGRGMSCNKEMTEAGWREWFDGCVKLLVAYDMKTLGEVE